MEEPEEPNEELEPLFDYSRVQPLDVVCLDDDSSDSSPVPIPKRRKKNDASAVGKDNGNGKAIEIIDSNDKEVEDWLAPSPPPPPPRVARDLNKLSDNSTILEMRLKKQELVSCTQSVADVMRAVEESVRKDFGTQPEFTEKNDSEKAPERAPCERAKVVISIQDKQEVKQFRVYKDENFEKLFKMYADKLKLDPKNLVFCFDGDKILPTATPSCLGMEDDDIIEVHVKSS